ncbi:hypothetical protein L3Y34_018003 [Caenorhabditis briggsae]|uniref:Uncharacterized protein n=1 Tax=Caenorhabditis briggsae TaxID=6238 RepID=A0AAE9DJ07_CAEBR|nr:hypothetical protein L3Y34_018003 [Caenorhabditis briggsae]
MSSQQQVSSRQLSHKPVENLVHRDVLAPDKPPRVRWHSEFHVWICRNVGQLLLFILFLAVCFVLGPCLISFMYPNVIVPFNTKLDWKCKRLESYSQLKASNLAWETNLMAAGSSVNIQVYVRDKNTTLEDLEKILLVIDDCGFDDFGENVVLCRPVSKNAPRSTFKQSVKVAEICYHYIRQITKKAIIASYGKGITANILLATAVKLREEYCYSFGTIFIEDPIMDVKNEFKKNSWIGISFMLPYFREQMMTDTIQDYGFHEAEVGDNIKRVHTTVRAVAEEDFESIYGANGGLVTKGKKKDIFLYMKPGYGAPKVPGNSSFQFRHSNEGECAKKANIPLTSVMIL